MNHKGGYRAARAAKNYHRVSTWNCDDEKSDDAMEWYYLQPQLNLKRSQMLFRTQIFDIWRLAQDPNILYLIQNSLLRTQMRQSDLWAPTSSSWMRPGPRWVSLSFIKTPSSFITMIYMKVRKENPDASIGEVAKILGKMWGEIEPADKAKFDKVPMMMVVVVMMVMGVTMRVQ